MASSDCSPQIRAPLPNGGHIGISGAGHRSALSGDDSPHVNTRSLQVSASVGQFPGTLDGIGCSNAMDEHVSSRNSSISTASTLAPPADHPVVWGDNFLVYFEPREFHKSNINKIYHYHSSEINEEEACAILMADLAARGSSDEALDHLDRAMRLMLNAIAMVDKERAINIEESNDTTGYRTLSTVLRDECLDRDLIARIRDLWRSAAQGDHLVGHCAQYMPDTKIRLLAELTFTHSAPMLSWTMDLPVGWYR